MYSDTIHCMCVCVCERQREREREHERHEWQHVPQAHYGMYFTSNTEIQKLQTDKLYI
jgi:hypothetical protein